ncbi:MAG: DUF4272 domain-containing protein [Promethearchaeota archaeon]
MTNLNSIDIKSYKKLIKQGRNYLKKNKNTKAIRIFEKMLEINPQDYGVWWYKGMTYTSLGENNIAIQCFEKYINLHPENPCKTYKYKLDKLDMKTILLTMFRLCTDKEERNKFFEEVYKIEQMDFNRSESSLARKKKSEEMLKQENIPFIQSLPAIEDETLALRRSKEEVANRCLCLLIVAFKGEGLEDEYLMLIIEQYREIWDHFTNDEILFLKEKRPDEDLLMDFSWRFECAWVLLWSLSYVENLGRPDKMIDIRPVDPFLNKVSYDDFISNAHLRPLSEILDKADLIYRYDWAAVDARINSKPTPGNLNEEVLYEWHRTFNWLIGHKNQYWDDITTDM